MPLTLSENITTNWSCKPQQNTKSEIKQKVLIGWSTEILGEFSNAVLQRLEYIFFFSPTTPLTELIELNVFCGAS